VAYAIWFKEVVAAGRPGELLWGIAISASMLVIGIVSPWIGAIADFSASKRGWLIFYTTVCVVGTALLFLVGPGDVAAGMGFFVLANIGFAGALAIYNGFLPEITGPGNVGRISGYGYALGYAGGTLALLMCLPLLMGGVGEENHVPFRATFLITAAFYAGFSIPTFLWLRERAVAGRRPDGTSLARIGYARVAATFRRVRDHRELFRFLIAYVIYNDGVETIIYFSAIYARTVIGFSMSETVFLFIGVQCTALIGSVIFGHLADRIGAKPTLNRTLLIWCAVCVAAFAVTTRAQFWGVSLIAGLVLGAAQASSRGLMRLFIPAGRDAEFYGFFAICQKFSALIGPLAYGIIATVSGDQRIAILSILGFFVAGLVILRSVDVARGAEAARAMRY